MNGAYIALVWIAIMGISGIVGCMRSPEPGNLRSDYRGWASFCVAVTAMAIAAFIFLIAVPPR